MRYLSQRPNSARRSHGRVGYMCYLRGPSDDGKYCDDGSSDSVATVLLLESFMISYLLLRNMEFC